MRVRGARGETAVDMRSRLPKACLVDEKPGDRALDNPQCFAHRGWITGKQKTAVPQGPQHRSC